MQEIILTFVPIISRTDAWISLSVILLMWPFRHFLSQIWSGWLPILYRMERNPLCRRTLHHVGIYGPRPQCIEHAVVSLTWNVFSAHKEAKRMKTFSREKKEGKVLRQGTTHSITFERTSEKMQQYLLNIASKSGFVPTRMMSFESLTDVTDTNCALLETGEKFE